MDDKINQLANDLAEQLLNSIKQRVEDQINQTVTSMIRERVNSADVVATIKDNIVEIFNITSTHFPFGPNTVPGSAVDVSSLSQLPGDLVSGGVVKNFASTGIDDRASVCQVTVMDAGTVFENKLYAKELEVKGDTVIDGNLVVRGVIPKDTTAYQSLITDVTDIANETYQRVFDRIQNQSLDVNQITVAQRSIIEGSALTSAVISSQLQQVGILQDLQTAGETLLSETLYASNRRVGINTMDPACALSVWDEEIEIGIGKQSKNTAQINSRATEFIISVANKKNITLTDSGTTVIPQLQLGNMLMSSSPTPPNYNANKGTVVFNENPSLGGPLGWVSLGDARWANFGVID